MWDLGRLTGQFDATTTVPIARINAAWRAWDAFKGADTLLATTLDAVRDQPRTEAIGRFEAAAATLEQELAVLARGDASSSRMRTLTTTVQDWRAAALVLLGGAPAASIPAPHTMDRRGAAIRAALQSIISEATVSAAEARQLLGAQASQTTLFTAVLACAAVLAAVGVAIPFALTLTRPLGRLNGRMLAMAGGDLDTPIADAGRPDEIGGIATALHTLRDGLLQRRTLEAEAAIVHQAADAKLRETEAAFAAAGQEQTELVERLARALAAIAAGDLTTRVARHTTGIYAKLGQDFDQAIGSLEATVGAVTAATGHLNTDAENIAHTAVDLSKRSEQQAARLQDAAASLAEVSVGIRATASQTREASGAVADANVAADRSGSLMRDAIQAIGRIEQSSNQITQIIDVIDEIAFQTNILALNAAVEAARAGEGGRGFSIVAAEVRALAQRSAAAAKEIKTLIDQTSASVRDGANLLGRTGSSMDGIMDKVADVNRLVGEVATAAEQQAKSLNDVVACVSTADRETRQHAEISEQSARSIHRIRDQSTTLAELVGQFRTNAEAIAGGVSLTSKRRA